MRKSKIAAGMLGLAVVAAACGRADVTSPGTDPTEGREPDSLILRVFLRGGFVPPEFHLRQMPEFTLTGDGRVFTMGPQITIHPPPALPNVLVRDLTAEGVRRIIVAAEDAGLGGPDREYRYDLVADAGTVVFTYTDADGEKHEISAYALGFSGEESPTPPGQTEEEREARAKLASLRTMLQDLTSWLPEGSVGEERQYQIERLRVFAGRFPAGDEQMPQQPKDWPGTTPLSGFGEARDDGFRCGVLEGADLDAVLPELTQSNTLTPWVSEGIEYLLVLRPLLPDETGCPAD